MILPNCSIPSTIDWLKIARHFPRTMASSDLFFHLLIPAQQLMSTFEGFPVPSSSLSLAPKDSAIHLFVKLGLGRTLTTWANVDRWEGKVLSKGKLLTSYIAPAGLSPEDLMTFCDNQTNMQLHLNPQFRAILYHVAPYHIVSLSIIPSWIKCENFELFYLITFWIFCLFEGEQNCHQQLAK